MKSLLAFVSAAVLATTASSAFAQAADMIPPTSLRVSAIARGSGERNSVTPEISSLGRDSLVNTVTILTRTIHQTTPCP